MKDNECCIWMQQENNQTTLNVYFGGPAIFTVNDRRVGGTDYVVGKVGHLLPQDAITSAVMIGTTTVGGQSFSVYPSWPKCTRSTTSAFRSGERQRLMRSYSRCAKGSGASWGLLT